MTSPCLYCRARGARPRLHREHFRSHFGNRPQSQAERWLVCGFGGRSERSGCQLHVAHAFAAAHAQGERVAGVHTRRARAPVIGVRMSCPSMASITSVATSLPAAAPSGSIALMTTPDERRPPMLWRMRAAELRCRGRRLPRSLLQALHRTVSSAAGTIAACPSWLTPRPANAPSVVNTNVPGRNRRRGRKQPDFSGPQGAHHRKQPADEHGPQRNVLACHLGRHQVSRVIEQARRPWHDARHVAVHVPDDREACRPIRREQRVRPARQQRHGGIAANAERGRRPGRRRDGSDDAPAGCRRSVRARSA